MKKVLYIIFLFIIFVIGLTINSLAFEEGDEVQATSDVHIYSPIYSGGAVPMIVDYSESDDDLFEKGTILIYQGVENKARNLCKVSPLSNKEHTYIVKESSLKKYDKETDSKNQAALEILEKYQEKISNGETFADMTDEEIATGYTECTEALKYLKKESDKTLMGGMITSFKLEAEKRELLDENGNIKDNIENNATDFDEEADRIDEENRENGLSTGEAIYKNPKNTTGGGAGDSLDDMISDADRFLIIGDNKYASTEKLQDFSNTMYNILLSVGVAVAVIVGAIIGVKLMASNIDTKAEAKKLLIPYVVGCVVVFGGFGIWKIVVSILQGM